MIDMNQLKDMTNIRQNLLDIKENFNHEYNQLIIENQAYFIDLLSYEDSKVRKNVADLLAKCNDERFKDILYTTYKNENQMMIRSGLLKAAGNYDLSNYISELETREQELISMQTGEHAKHVKEELRILRKILQNYRQLPKHEFIGFKKDVPIILTVPNGHQEALVDELVDFECKIVSMGVQVKTNRISRLFENRIFGAMYFPLCKSETIDLNQEVVSKITRFLQVSHEGNDPFRFRLDLEEGVDSRKLAQQLEIISEGKLQNYPGDYEVELRIRNNKKGEALVYIKLMTIKDERFTYRVNPSSTSLAAHTAALIAHYLQDYVKEDGQVLDAMCNDGTLLIERTLAMPPHFVMGLYYSADLMAKAKQHANLAHVNIRFVQRDLKTFTHQRLFDEVLCQLPSVRKKEEQKKCEALYLTMFRKTKELMAPKGIFACYSHEQQLITQAYNKNRSHLQLLKEIPIVGKKSLYIFEVLDTYTQK